MRKAIPAARVTAQSGRRVLRTAPGPTIAQQLIETVIEPGTSVADDRRPEFQRMIEAGASKPALFDVAAIRSFIGTACAAMIVLWSMMSAAT